MEKFLNIFQYQIAAEKIGFFFEFRLGGIILHLEELFKMWQKTLKRESQAYAVDSYV